jgi:hypothetical protein
MRPILSVVLLTTFTLILMACSGNTAEHPQTDSWQSVTTQAEGEVTLAYVPSDGFSYVDDSEQLTGVTIEIVRDFVFFIEREYDVELTLHTHPIESFSDFYQFVKQGESGLFGVANVTITEPRKEEIAFSPHYMTNIATLITHADTPEIERMSQIAELFSGLDALAFEGTLHQDRLQRIMDDYLPESGMDFAHSNNEIIERTAEMNRYFAYVDIYNYWRATDAGMPLTRHAVGDEASEQFGVIMPHGSDWQPLWEEFFDHDGGYLNSERYEQLMTDHLGPELAELLIRQNRENP